MQPAEACQQINDWVAESTNNIIDSIVGPGSVDTDTRLVVTNAVYSKGRWQTPFDESDTTDREFHRAGGGAVDAEFTSSREDQFTAVHDGFKALRMPYQMPGNISSCRPSRESGSPERNATTTALLHVRVPAGRARRPVEPRGPDGLQPGLPDPGPHARQASQGRRVPGAQVQARLLRQPAASRCSFPTSRTRRSSR